MSSEKNEHTRRSQSSRESGWVSYPVEEFHKIRPPDLIHDLPFWQYCAEKYGHPILDLCCGNGRIAIPLAELGHKVVGVDINQDFISSAQERVEKIRSEGRELDISFHLADIVDLELRRAFSLAIMPDWSLQVLLTQEDQLSFLRRLHRHLLPDGAFAFNLFIPFHRQRNLIENGGLYRWPPDPSYHSGAPRSYDVVSQIESLVDHNVHQVKLRHTSLSELKLLFRLTGFKIVELYGSDDRRPFTGSKNNDYTIVARKL